MFNLFRKGGDKKSAVAVAERPVGKPAIEKLISDDLALLEKIWGLNFEHNIITRIKVKVDELSIKLKEIKSLLSVPQPVKEEFLKLDGERQKIEEDLSETYRRLQTINRIIQAGYEIFTPNKGWYRGFVYKSDAEAAHDRMPSEFPALNDGWLRGMERLYVDCFVFKGAIPPHVQNAYLKAIDIFGPRHIQVYSPRKEDFEVISTHPDPVIVGSAQVDDRHWLFFKIAMWGTTEDLKAMDDKK